MKRIFSKFLALSCLMALAAGSAFAYGGAVAIIWNPQTGAWATHHGGIDRAAAEQGAVNAAVAGGNYSLNVSVAAIEQNVSAVKETWAFNGWVALAQGFNAFGNRVYGGSSMHDSEYDAEQSALDNCPADNCRIIRSLSSYEFGPDFNGVGN